MSNASPATKQKYLVETSGAFVVKKAVYEAIDPDEAAHLAFRNEAFYLLMAKYPMYNPKQVLAHLDRSLAEGKVEMPQFKIKKITVVPAEVKS